MKYVLYTALILIAIVTTMKVTHYSERMQAYNAHVCKVEGYQPDCKTPLLPSEYLK